MVANMSSPSDTKESVLLNPVIDDPTVTRLSHGFFLPTSLYSKGHLVFLLCNVGQRRKLTYAPGPSEVVSSANTDGVYSVFTERGRG